MTKFIAKASASRKLRTKPGLTKSDKGKRSTKDLDLDSDFDLDLSNDIKGIMSAFQQITEKAQKDSQEKNEETISSVTTEIKSIIDDLKFKFEKDRQTFAKALLKSSKEFENSLKNETEKFQSLYQNFSEEKATHMQALKDTISKFEEEKERLFKQHEQMRKKEKSMISEHEKACADKIAKLEESLKKKTQIRLLQISEDEKTFSILRKTLGSFLDNASDEDFPPDD